MTITRINPPNSPSRSGHTSIITVESPTRLAWFSSQKPQGPDLECVAPGDLKKQYEFVMDQLELQLSAIGAGWDNVVVEKLYLTDTESFRSFQGSREYKTYYSNPPCRTSIGVPRLSHPEFLIEAEILVALPDGAARQPS